MIRIVALILLLAVMVPFGANFSLSARADALELATDCEKLINGATIDGDRTNIPSGFGPARCYGFFQAIRQLVAFKGDDGNSVIGICPPSNSKLLQFVRIFVTHAHNNPQNLHHPEGMEVINALLKSFPCGKTQ